MSKIYVDEILPKDNATVDGSNLSAVPASAISTLNASALPTGSVLQVVSSTKTDTYSTTSTSWTDVPDLSVTLTPSSSTNKLLVMANVILGHSTYLTYLRVERDGSMISSPDSASTRPLIHATNGYSGTDTTYMLSSTAVQLLETAGSTSSTTFNVAVKSYSSSYTAYVNRGNSDRDMTSYDPRGISSITVMEIAG